MILAIPLQSPSSIIASTILNYGTVLPMYFEGILLLPPSHPDNEISPAMSIINIAEP
jgi:hypothetical protein